MEVLFVPYLGCRLVSRGKERIVYVDSYFIQRVTPINISLLVYPYNIIRNCVIDASPCQGIVLEGTTDCGSVIDYVVDVYRGLKSESLKLFKRMYWYNVSNIIVPVRFSPTTRSRLNQYEKMIGELTASAMLLDRVLGKDVLRGDYSAENVDLVHVRITVSRQGDGTIRFSNCILGKVYTRLYEIDEKFRDEVNRLMGSKPP